ncbi:uncharacterized protein LOC130051336 [Ostrea edulis]|uniref:uncharacterized protein LOC130051336 n=1 Tax=Ostrea edulis TaxID=37623 RepID=UPI0024AF365C|nr:uncharacterized protein LOC130051336 [Ostrea edulis]
MAKLLVISGFLFFHIGAFLCLEFNPDGDTVKGATVSLVCTIAPSDFTSPISLTKDGSLKTSCDNTNLCNPPNSDAGRYVYSSNSSTVAVTITSLRHTTDTGNWTCSIASSSKEYTLVVQTEPSVTTFINGSSTAPVLGTKYKIVNLSARSYCFFPSTSSANLQYSIGISGSVLPLTTISVVQLSAISVGCEANEFDLQTNVTVDIDSSTYAELSGKSNVYFQITFTSSLGTQHSTDYRFGPYDFEVCSVGQFWVG